MGEERVLQVVGPSTGGMGAHAGFLGERLAGRGWTVDTLTSVPRSSSPLALWNARRAVQRGARGADVIHAHGLKAGWVAASIPRHRRPPVVVTVHNLVLDAVAGRSSGPLRWLQSRLARRADATIAVSREIAATVGGRVIWPAAPLPAPGRSPAETRAAHGIDDGRPLVVCVARLHPQKGLHTLIDAAEALTRRVPDVAVLVVGEGPQRTELQAHIDRRSLGAVVYLAGHSANAADELRAADVVAMTSIWESGPLVVMEAMALARPVVATPVGFVGELVLEHVTGRVVSIGDAPACADALAEILGDPDGAARLGHAGRMRVLARFDPEVLVAEVEEVYRGLMAR
ncbi:MAG: glycosyltransferase family 4 protein [Acidimicrobiia bacterium]